MEKQWEIITGDALEELRRLPAKSCALGLIDPPYNVGVVTEKHGRKTRNAWDVFGSTDAYVAWCMDWIREARSVLTDNAVVYIWQGDMAQAAALMEAIRRETPMEWRGLLIWDKGEAFRANIWHNRREGGRAAPRSWFNRCEYILHYFNLGDGEKRARMESARAQAASNPNYCREIKDWYRAELVRLGLTEADMRREYEARTGKKPYMLRHYFRDSQFELPTREVWEKVFEPLGFVYPGEYDAMRAATYDAMRAATGQSESYAQMLAEYEAKRNVHNVDAMHSNVFRVKPISTNGRLHTCQKPVEILRRLVRVSSKPGDVVLDCFAGSGSTGVAALCEGRRFIGIEQDADMAQTARRRIAEHEQQITWDDVFREARA